MADRRLEDQLQGVHVALEIEEEGSKANNKKRKGVKLLMPGGWKDNLSRPGRT